MENDTTYCHAFTAFTGVTARPGAVVVTTRGEYARAGVSALADNREAHLAACVRMTGVVAMDIIAAAGVNPLSIDPADLAIARALLVDVFGGPVSVDYSKNTLTVF
jgi:hypothetical protein